MAISLSDKYALPFLAENEIKDIAPEVYGAAKLVADKSGAGGDFLGWVNLPFDYDKQEFDRIKKAAANIRETSQILVVIGIGGSYLGARAAIEFLHGENYNLLTSGTQIFFTGNSISGSALSNLLTLCEGKDVSVNVISKSGTTTEPAIAFRVFKEYLENRYGKQGAAKRIYCTTDRARGTLKALADKEGYECFVIPDDIGGRYSVLTAVGLLPIAVSGADIDKLMSGAQNAAKKYENCDIENNDCYKYAALRNLFYRRGYTTEILAAYEPRFALMNEWFKQLYGESEGKDNKGLFPASCIFSTDLHSMGQYIQDGRRTLFETVVNIKECGQDIVIKENTDNGDGLNFLAGKTMSYVNNKAFLGTVLAHTDGKVPNIIIDIDKADEENLGELIYFFEKACGVSGYLLGVNPFNQPGVESYKKNMFALLGKPGYEDNKKALEQRLSK